MKQAQRARDLVLKVFEALQGREDLSEQAQELEQALRILAPLADGIQIVDSGDPAMAALRTVLSNKHVPAELQLDLMSLAEDLGEVGSGARPRLLLGMLRLIMRWSLLDPTLAPKSNVSFYRAGTWLVEELGKTGHVTVERLKDVGTLAAALERCEGEEHVQVFDVLAARGGPEVRVLRPLLRVEGDVKQPAALLRAVPTDDAVAVGFDEVLFQTEDRLRAWQAGVDPRVRPMHTEAQRQVLERVLKRIGDVRATMREAAASGGPVAPPETARRDVTKLVIDMVHRVHDTLATLPQHREAYQGAFGELVFQDVVFRQLVPYLSQEFGIDLDTDVVAGADVQRLAGRYKEEKTGLKPKVVNKKVFSVVVPGYQMGGVNVRPATVRLGVY